MSRLLIGFNNLADLAILSGGTWDSARPLANLKTRTLAAKARTTTTGATIAANILSASVRVVALFGTNLTADATYRVQCGAYDSGTLSINAPDNYRLPVDVVHVLPSAVTAASVTVTVTDTGNAAGYVEFGRLFIGGALELPSDQANGAAISFETTTTASRERYGEQIFKAGRQLRTVDFSVVTDDTVGAENAWLLQGYAGIDGEVVYIHDAAVDNVAFRWLGTLSKLGAHQYLGARARSVGFSIVEAG